VAPVRVGRVDQSGRVEMAGCEETKTGGVQALVVRRS
jgi:hypothetical protein